MATGFVDLTSMEEMHWKSCSMWRPLDCIHGVHIGSSAWGTCVLFALECAGLAWFGVFMTTA